MGLEAEYGKGLKSNLAFVTWHWIKSRRQRFEWSRKEGNGTPLQYSCLENPIDGGAWKAAVHGVAEGQTWLSNFTFTFHFHAMEKEMATHSSVLAWRIPGTGSLEGCRLWGHTESDTTEVTQQQQEEKVERERGIYLSSVFHVSVTTSMPYSTLQL